MQLQHLGNEGLQVSALGLGCMGMTFGYGPVPFERARATIDRALELGINFFDTSDHYGPLTNETLLGQVLAGRRDQVIVATKFGSYPIDEPGRVPDGRPEHVRRAVDGSLKRLGVDYIDLYYQHRVDPHVPIEDTLGAMSDLVTAGKIRFLGLSEAAASTIRRAHATHAIAAVQSEYSLWSRDAEKDVIPTVRELGIGFVAYSPLGRGFLAATITSPDDLAENDFRRISPRFQGDNLSHNRRLLTPIQAVAQNRGLSPAQVALAWVFAMLAGVVPIPGTTRPERIGENAAAVGVRLTDDELRHLDATFQPSAAAGTRWPERMMPFLDGATAQRASTLD
jgi:aryl-alcohol dehydrogenase-like predicted oxidoreductase